MRHRNVIAALVVVVCLSVGFGSAFAGTLVWQTSKETAVAMAKSQGKKILLIAGRDPGCSVTEWTKHTAAESVSPPIKSLIEQHFVPWFCDIDASAEADSYVTGMGPYSLPLICVIDPNNSDTYLDRTTGAQDLQVLYSRLSQYGSLLYFPHVDTRLPWQTEIAIINTSDQTVTGTLRALGVAGEPVDTKSVTLSARGRRQITVANEFRDHTNIAYIIYEADSDAVQGYTKFSQEGIQRAAIPAVKESNADIYISHVASDARWSTGVILVNTTATTKVLTITFNDGRTREITLNAKEHKAFDIAGLFDNQSLPNIQSAVITNASGIIGVEIFGDTVGGNQMDGILLTGKTTPTLYYPDVAGGGWWTGIVAYNPSELPGTITITPYDAQGTPLFPMTRSLGGKEQYIGTPAELGLPAATAWFKIDSTRPLTGFELFGNADYSQLAAYAGGGATGAKTGIFPKIEENGWTGIALVNTAATATSVTLTAYRDDGTPVAARVLPINGHAKEIKLAEDLFSQDISGANYIGYSADGNVVGFQLNGSSDGMMLDGLPALTGAN
jgi:hypothetical protein